MPFPGTFHTGLPLRNYLPYGRELLEGGLERAAVTAFARAAEANPGAPTLYRLGTLLARSGETARAGAVGANRLIAALLFGVQPTDPATLGAVTVTITLVAAVACWLPAWRASRLDPSVVLRTD